MTLEALLPRCELLNKSNRGLSDGETRVHRIIEWTAYRHVWNDATCPSSKSLRCGPCLMNRVRTVRLENKRQHGSLNHADHTWLLRSVPG